MRSPMFRNVLLLSLISLPSMAAITRKNVSYELDKTTFESVLVFDDAATPRPGVLLVPNWLGINEANLKQAELVASRGYVVFVADVYGASSRPKNQEEAGKMAGGLKGDRVKLRARMKKALERFLSQKLPQLDARRVGAIGFCFGGTAALELARTGAKVGGVVSFHGGLGSPTPEDAKNISARVLALHGADDPAVPPEEVASFQAEMRSAKVDYQLVSFGNAVHSFTDVDAKVPGRNEYNPVVAARAYAMMDAFFAEALR